MSLQQKKSIFLLLIFYTIINSQRMDVDEIER